MQVRDVFQVLRRVVSYFYDLFPSSMLNHRPVWKQDRPKENYDRGTKPLPELNRGDQIRIRNENFWEPGMVERKLTRPDRITYLWTEVNDYVETDLT